MSKNSKTLNKLKEKPIKQVIIMLRAKHYSVRTKKE